MHYRHLTFWRQSEKEKMNLTATTGAGVLVRQGQMSDGVWFWTFQYPVRMRLVGQTTSKPEQSFVFEITIQRVDPRLKPSGMEIRQIISRNTDRTPEISNMQSRYLLSTLLLV